MAGKSAKLENDFILFASTASHLLAEKKVDKALKICEAGVREFPFYAPGHYILALCYDSLGKKDDAKNEFERVLIFDPSHNTAMRKLSEIYSRNGLNQVANELLVKEALYSPLNLEIIDILKEKNLYDSLCPIKEMEMPDEDSVDTEYQEPAEEFDIVSESIEDEDEEFYMEPIHEEAETEDFIVKPELQESEETPDILPEDTTISDAENASAFANLDPLAGSEERDIEDFEGDLSQAEVSEISDAAMRKDSPEETKYKSFNNRSESSSRYSDDDEEIDENEWLEVENLLIDESYDHLDSSGKDTYSSVLPQSEMLRNDTELLLEELKSAEAESDEADTAIYDTNEETVLDDQVAAIDLSDKTLTGDIEEDNFVDEDKNSELYDVEEGEVTIKDMMENPNLVTPTFGEILIAQHKFSEARHVFLQLKKREPENPRFEKKINFLNKFLEAQDPA